MIRQFIEEAVRKIEVEKERQCVAAKERVTREKILPYNAEIDKARDEAVAQKQRALNENIVALQETFAKEKQAIAEAAEKKKHDNAEAILASEITSVTVEYEKHIAKLKNQIEDIKE